MKNKTKLFFAVVTLFLIIFLEGCATAYVGVGVYGPGAWGTYGTYGTYGGRIGAPYWR